MKGVSVKAIAKRMYNIILKQIFLFERVKKSIASNEA